jgi:hypothetical protein
MPKNYLKIRPATSCWPFQTAISGNKKRGEAVSPAAPFPKPI